MSRDDADGIPLAEYARHRKGLGLSGGTYQSVQRARDSGRIAAAMSSDGKRIIDVALADRLWSETTLDRRPSTGPGGSTVSAVVSDDSTVAVYTGAEPPALEISRRRKEAAQAELSERQLARDKGDYLEIDKVKRDLAREYSAIQNRLLAIPSQLATRLDRDEHRRVAPIVEQLVRDALVQLADRVEEGVDAAP